MKAKFCNYIHVYNIQQAALDKETVFIYYDPCLIILDNMNTQLKEGFDSLVSKAGSSDER